MEKTEFASPSVSEESTRTRGRSALDVVMLSGLSVVVVGNVVAMVIEGGIIPPVLIATIAYLVCGIVVATGWRWSMVLPLVFCSLGIVADFASGFPEYSLTHPSANYVAFSLFVINYPLLIMVIVAAAVKLAQTLRHETPHVPEWMHPALGAVGGLVLGAFLIGMIAQSPSAGGAPAVHAGTQTVHVAAASFAPDIIALHKGDTLTIVDDAPQTCAGRGARSTAYQKRRSQQHHRHRWPLHHAGYLPPLLHDPSRHGAHDHRAVTRHRSSRQSRRSLWRCATEEKSTRV